MPITDQTPDVTLYDSNGVELAVSNGVATPVGTRGLIIAGEDDGAITRFLRMDTDGSARNNPSANSEVSGTIVALNGTVEIDTHGCSLVGAQITGVWNATVVGEATINGVDWFPITGFAVGRLGAVSSMTQNGNFQAIVAGFHRMRVRASVFVAGPISVALTATVGSGVESASIAQYVQVSANNSSTVNLAAGATFTGIAEGSLGVNSIQVNFKADQPCTLQVQQSTDGTNWDIVDTYTLAASSGDGRTFQTTAGFFRVLVTNKGSALTTFLRLDTVICPVAEVLPRSLTSQGNLRSALADDAHRKQAEFSAFAQLKTITESILGDLRFDATSVPDEWNVTTTNLGNYTIEPGGTGIKMSTGAAAASKITLRTKRTFFYQSARGQILKFSIILGDAGVAGNIREWGQKNVAETNGLFLRMNGTTLSLVRLFNGVETVIPSTSWDIPVTPDANGHIWYLQYGWLGVGDLYLYYDEQIVHTIRFSGTSVDFSIGTPDLPVWFRNENVANASNVYMKSGCASVATEGGNVISGVGSDGQLNQVGVDANGNLKVVVEPISIDATPGTFGGTATLGGGSVGTFQPVRGTTYTEPAAAAQRSVSSTSASDAAAGVGAQTVTITYYDSVGAGPYTETITLNGVGAVNTVATNIRYIDSIVTTTVGSTGWNVGTIRLHSAAGGAGTIIGSIGLGNLAPGVGDQRTLWAHHYVPAGKLASITALVVGASVSSTFHLQVQQTQVANAPDQIIAGLTTTTAAFERTFETPLKVTGPARITAIGVPSANNATLTATFDVIEVAA